MNNKTEVTALPETQVVSIERDFDASRDLVFRSFSEPDLIKQWMAFEGGTCTIDKLENRSGGEWRFIHEDCDGNKAAFSGVIHEVAAPERIIRTFEFEDLPERGHVSLEFLSLEAISETRTKILIESVFRSKADRDGFIQSGADVGIAVSHKNLDRLLEKLKAVASE